MVVVVVGAGVVGPGYTVNGVDEPGVGFHPGGGVGLRGHRAGRRHDDRRRPARSSWAAGAAAPGAPAAWTRPKPARSDHQMELTWTTVPVWGALIISPSPM